MSKTTSTTGSTISTADLKRYAADPMEFFAATIVPGAGTDTRLSACWADFQRDAFAVLADCLLAVANGDKPQYRGIWCERTKGASKDSDIGLGLCWLLMFSRRPQCIELGADDFDQIGETRKAMIAIINSNPWMASRLTVQAEKILCAATSSEALFLHGSRTTAATGSHGSRPTVTVLNELSHCSSEDFISTLMDNSDKVANNLCIIATNAGELGSWQWRWRENYRVDPTWFFQQVDGVAPWIDAAKVRDAERRNPPSRFARLWKGIWTAPGGDLLSAAQIKQAVVWDCPLFSRHTPATYPLCGLGVDLAAGGRHHASIVVLLGDRYGKLRVARVVDFPPPVSISAVKQKIEYLGDNFRTRALFSDSWGAGLLAEQLVSAGWDVEVTPGTGNAARAVQAAALVESFQNETLELYEGEDAAELLLQDLASCRLVEKSNGTCIELAENDDGHSDRLAALLQVLPPMLRAMGSLPVEAGGMVRSDEREPEPIEDDPRDWRKRALRPMGGWHGPPGWQG